MVDNEPRPPQSCRTRRRYCSSPFPGLFLAQAAAAGIDDLYDALVDPAGGNRARLSFDAFQLAARKQPEAAEVWLKRLQLITRSDCQSIFNQIPLTEISETAIQFALTILELNKKRLLEGDTAP